MKVTTAYALAWISVATTVSIGIVVSKSLIPMWFLLIPACISISSSKG